ncbi:MAG: MBL fold metallo-hydrolase [Oligoflexia bacterium]|nr:MBL fold metallo-hydrolase [Oligoflexia bacterium]
MVELMLEIVTVPVTGFQQNCRLIGDPSSGTAVVIDPGGDVPHILQVLKQRGWRCVEIWLTHSHLDHCGGVTELIAASGAKLTAHALEREFRERVAEIAAMYGIPQDQFKACPEPDRAVVASDVLRFGGQKFEVRFTPGHSPGHVVFYCAELGLLLAGDTVFAGSIGRTDLPGGDYEQLMQSIAEQILTLPDSTKLLPGHGPDTTIGEERRSNPFLQDL